MTHQEAARNVASVHICPSITRTGIRVNYTLYGRLDIPSGSNQSVDGWKRWESQRITFVDFSALLANSLTALTSTARTANRGKNISQLSPKFFFTEPGHTWREKVCTEKDRFKNCMCVQMYLSHNPEVWTGWPDDPTWPDPIVERHENQLPCHELQTTFNSLW